MKRVVAASSVLALVMIGYAVSASSAQSVNEFPIAVGQRLRLWYPESGSGITCTIAAVRNDFVRCTLEQVGRFQTTPAREEWFNLRTLRSFERLTNDR